MSGRAPWAVAGLVALVLVVALWLGVRGNAGVVDEHPHVLSGSLYWQSGSFAGGFDNPPLGQLWLTLPFALSGFDYHFPDDAHLVWPRLMSVLSTLLFAGVIAWWGSWLLGAWGAVLSLLFFACEPNLLAHGHLATLDMLLAGAWWATLAAARLWLTGRRGALWCVGLGVAVASLIKFTGLLLLPALLLVVCLVDRRRALSRAAQLLGVALVWSWALAWLVYGFAEARLGWPAAFIDALQGKWAHRSDGHFSYLMGRRSLQGFPEYNLVALAVKTTLPMLALAGLGMTTRVRAWTRLDRSLVGVPAMLVLLLFSWGGVNIGVRHLLPLLPALVLCAAAGVRHAWSPITWRRVATATLLLWMVVSVGRLTPQWLAYFNEAAGGPGRGDRWLLDSNLDWGQDDQRIDTFLRHAEQEGRPVDVLPPALEPRTGRLAVNVNALHGLLRMSDAPYAWLRRHVPHQRVGWSWRIWDLQVEDFRNATVQHPDDVARWTDYARVLASNGDAEGALQLLSQRRAQLDVRGWQAAAHIALEADRLQQAEAWLQDVPGAFRGDPDWQALLVRSELEGRIRDGDAQARLELGVFWAQAGEAQRAEPLLQSAAASRPQDVAAQGAWLVFLGQQGRYDEAVQVARQPAVARALGPQAQILERAAASLASLESPQPAPVAHLRELAQSEFEAERYDVAAHALVHLLRQQPGDRDALHLLGELQVRSKLRVVDAVLTPRSLRRTAGGQP